MDRRAADRSKGGRRRREGSRASAFGPLALLLGLATTASTAMAQSANDGWPVAVTAHYRLQYNGINVGQLSVISQRKEGSYTLSGSGKVSVLFGAITWSGSSTVSGVIADGKPQPIKYAFEWRNNRKGGTIN